MKKVFTLALALMVAFVGYSQVKSLSVKDAKPVAAQERVYTGTEIFQHVGAQPNMNRVDPESDAMLDYSYYDWHTNTAAKNWTMNFPDGCVGFAYTMSTDESHSDRGTDIIIYNPATDEWTSTEGKIEDRKTGFGCAARYGENGIVVVSRDANTLDCSIYIIEDKDNLPASGTVAPAYTWTKDDRNIHFPTVMCTGPDHKHIHILFTALNYTNDDGQVNPYYYFRSMDGGNTWDEFMTIDYLGRDYCPQYGSGSDAYFIENNGGNRLEIVVNTRRGDGAVLTSEDEGNTWTRTEFYHHPGIDVNFGEGLAYMYPRWTSALRDNNGVLHIAYEIGGGTGDATSTSYYPGIGSVAYWNSELPYAGDGHVYDTWGVDPNNPNPPVPGQPFIMDSAYMFQDIYAAWPRWSDQTYDNPYNFGYLSPLTPEGEFESWDEAQEFNIEDFTLHGSYNGGICEMPVLLTTPAQDLLVAVWMMMDEENVDGLGHYFFKLFATASNNGGQTWMTRKALTNAFTFQYSECVYPQAAITNNKLVVACQMDGTSGSFVIGGDDPDTDGSDNYYQGLVFDLNDLFDYDGVEEVEPAVKPAAMSIYPNPAVDQLNVVLSNSSDIVVYNIMGQAVRTVEGHVGVNAIDLNGLTSGVYFVNAGSNTQKFIVK